MNGYSSRLIRSLNGKYAVGIALSCPHCVESIVAVIPPTEWPQVAQLLTAR